MKVSAFVLSAAAIAFSSSMPAFAQVTDTTTTAQPVSTGTVKKVSADQGKITVSHGPLANLDMPAMTMVFRVADPKTLETVKTGDNIEFTADKVNGAFTIVRMEKVS
ncbi:copper-binding protein [Noviherbaspirillum sp.]|uniref:copper-binding protein n=1 Tax=Noviherbaspirillum sp. TaxID=1926288 RepID=UPI002FE19E72